MDCFPYLLCRSALCRSCLLLLVALCVIENGLLKKQQQQTDVLPKLVGHHVSISQLIPAEDSPGLLTSLVQLVGCVDGWLVFFSTYQSQWVKFHNNHQQWPINGAWLTWLSTAVLGDFLKSFPSIITFDDLHCTFTDEVWHVSKYQKDAVWQH